MQTKSDEFVYLYHDESESYTVMTRENWAADTSMEASLCIEVSKEDWLEGKRKQELLENELEKEQLYGRTSI